MLWGVFRPDPVLVSKSSLSTSYANTNARTGTTKTDGKTRLPMNNDQTFRAVLIVVLLLILPIGIYHRLKSQATGEKFDRWQEGLFILATLRPVGTALWLGLIAWVVDPGWMGWSSVSLPSWLRWIGVGVIAIACGLLVWTFRHTTRAHLGHTRSLSLGPASLLRLRRIARCGGFPDGGKLVPICDRRRAVLSVHHPNADRRRESACSLWK
jgi:hypothetical protein